MKTRGLPDGLSRSRSCTLSFVRCSGVNLERFFKRGAVIEGRGDVDMGVNGLGVDEAVSFGRGRVVHKRGRLVAWCRRCGCGSWCEWFPRGLCKWPIRMWVGGCGRRGRGGDVACVAPAATTHAAMPICGAKVVTFSQACPSCRASIGSTQSSMPELRCQGRHLQMGMQQPQHSVSGEPAALGGSGRERRGGGGVEPEGRGSVTASFDFPAGGSWSVTVARSSGSHRELT
jgi:hypothetical protein